MAIVKFHNAAGERPGSPLCPPSAPHFLAKTPPVISKFSLEFFS